MIPSWILLCLYTSQLVVLFVLLIGSLLWQLAWKIPVLKKLVLRVEAFGSHPALIPLSPLYKVYSVLNNSDLPLTSWRQKKAIAKAYISLGFSWTSLIINLKGFSCLVLWILLDSLWSIMGILLLQVSYLHYIYYFSTNFSSQ